MRLVCEQSYISVQQAFSSLCTPFPGSLVVYRVILSNEFCISSERRTNVACIKTRYIAYKTEEIEDINTAYTLYPIGDCWEDNPSSGPRAEDMGPGMNTSHGKWTVDLKAEFRWQMYIKKFFHDLSASKVNVASVTCINALLTENFTQAFDLT